MIVFVADLISIHALREESDKFEGDDHGIDAKISIHALRGESDEYLGGGRYHVNIFQSTPSARRATSPAAVYGYALEISIHALREEGDAEIVPSADTETPISIHALREEGDSVSSVSETFNSNFNPRPPRGGRPEELDGLIALMKISIHALREEGDVWSRRRSSAPSRFQSTPSARRAT